MEKTLILAKPDAVQRGLIGQIISRFEDKGLKLVAARFLQIDDSLAEKHYSVHRDKPFFFRLKEFITSGPVMAMVWQGADAIKISRNIMGATFGNQATAGTIRGDYCLEYKNLVHGSDSVESAEYEIGLYFTEDDFIDYTRDIDRWHYSD